MDSNPLSPKPFDLYYDDLLLRPDKLRRRVVTIPAVAGDITYGLYIVPHHSDPEIGAVLVFEGGLEGCRFSRALTTDQIPMRNSQFGDAVMDLFIQSPFASRVYLGQGGVG